MTTIILLQIYAYVGAILIGFFLGLTVKLTIYKIKSPIYNRKEDRRIRV